MLDEEGGRGIEKCLPILLRQPGRLGQRIVASKEPRLVQRAEALRVAPGFQDEGRRQVVQQIGREQDHRVTR